ncbi:hypothetical protein L6452_37001 [Arctium lappa]|uniref:Uncharacterized protein n=1 Tax=Arctium lappa TaxID=4217 RepID=A0ACB8Y2Y2_ARCLA|nr:hypothetical protein L6452_37001 [Arctium lappa]
MSNFRIFLDFDLESALIPIVIPRFYHRTLKIKTVANEVSLSTLRSRLSLHSSSSAATQEVTSPANPAATTASKRPSTALSGPSKKARKNKEITLSGSIPEVVSQQTTLDAFMGISSTTSATTTTTVPAMTIADTILVTTPISSVPRQQTEQPHAAPIEPDTQKFEGDMHFFNMFDLSGHNLKTVDAHVNTLPEKVDTLSTSLNETTSAVNNAGEELKKLTGASTSQNTTLQEELVKIKEDLIGLTSKVDSYNVLLQKVLAKLNELAPTPIPSFTENDHTSLNIAVEFIHQDTSDIPVIEGRLDCLEAEVRSLATSKDAPQTAELPSSDNDKEGEKVLEEENAEEATAEEDQSLWFSAVNVTLATTSKEVATKEVGERSETTSGTPSQGKQKGITATGNLNIVSQSEGENPSQFSPLLKGTELQIIPTITAEEQIIPFSFREINEQQQEEEALLHPGRPSRPAHWSEEELNKRT